MVGLVLLFLLALFCLLTPIAVGILGYKIEFLASAVLSGVGVSLMIAIGAIAVVTKLYQKAKANEAFVRTGMGGVKVIQDGGAIVIPVVHEVIRISLETLKLEVLRDGTEAFITKDNLRADIGAEFFVIVKAEKDAIIQASRSLGTKMRDAEQVKKAVEDKLVSALRSVAATKTLTELHTDREDFVKEVTKGVNDDLAANGLTLESVTISKLDQTKVSDLNDDNIFDAQGKRTIAEITEKQKTERNNLEKEGQRARKAQDVQTRKQILALEQDEQQASARQQTEIETVKYEQQRLAKEKAIATARAVELAEIEKIKSLEIAAIEKKKASEIATEQKEQEVSNASQLKADEQAKLAQAQALLEKETQGIETVKIEAAAEREKKRTVIEASAKAEESFVAAQREADAKAYSVQKDAEAKKAAADGEAEAITKKAIAEANAAKARAEGERAQQLVPVEVERERVNIDKDRIENVIKPELEARERSGKVAQDFEIAKLQVQADKEIRIETARASATIGAKTNMTLYGKPEDASAMIRSLVTGKQMAESINSFIGNVDPSVKNTLEGVIGSLTSLIGKKEDTKTLGDGNEPKPENTRRKPSPTPPSE